MAEYLSPTLEIARMPSGPRCATFSVAGEIDLATVGQLDETLNAALSGGAHRIVLDVSGVSFVGAPGLRALAGCAARLRAGQGMLVLCGASPFLQRLLALTHLEDVALVDATWQLARPGQPRPSGVPAKPTHASMRRFARAEPRAWRARQRESCRGCETTSPEGRR